MTTDGAGEFRRAFADLFIPHTTTAPGRSETNGAADRNIQSVSNCARALLEQSGLERFSGHTQLGPPPFPSTSAR
eukprot:5451416-Alexandrium_andersonii.AAC.1